MKIKFCGIRRLEDVAFCNELQPEYLGMILSSGFRRTISPETAEQLVKAKSRSIAAVGVFVNETPEHIAQVLKQVPLDVIQLHGSETAEIVSGVGKRLDIPSALVKVGDVISVMENSRAKEYFKGMDETLATKAVPAWLVLDAQNLGGKVDRFPTREEIDVPIEEHLIVELYSK